MYKIKSTDFTELSRADLIVGQTYEGGTKGNVGDDPLSKLMGCENQGGFRPVGSRDGKGTKFVYYILIYPMKIGPINLMKEQEDLFTTVIIEK